MFGLAWMVWIIGVGVLCLSQFAGAGEIHKAIQTGDLDRVKAVVAADPTTIEQPDSDTSLPLQLAVLGGHAAIVEWLVTHGATLEWTSPSLNHSALFLAAAVGHVDIVRTLAVHGAAVNVRGRVRLDGKTVEDVTPLDVAAMLGHEGAVGELLARGAVANSTTTPRRTALHLAARKISRDELEAGLRDSGPQGASLLSATRGFLSAALFGTGHRAVCALLVAHGADVNARDDNGWTPLGIAAAGGHMDVLTCLLDHGADLRLIDNLGYTALHSAAERGRADVERVLLARGAAVDAWALDGRTALHIAAQNGDRATIEALLDAKADANVRHQRAGWTPLYAAAVMGHPAAAATLLARGGRVDARDNDGGTALHFLARWRTDSQTKWPLIVGTDDEYRRTIRLLVGAGAEVNARVPSGRTALDLATRQGDEVIVAALLALGADSSVRDPEGFTPLHIATDRGNVSMLQLLLMRDIRSRTLMNTPARDGRTPLHLAAQAAFPTPEPGTPFPDYPRIVEILLTNGADGKARMNTGETPLDLAVRFGRSETARVLRQAPPHGVPAPAMTGLATWEQQMEGGNRAFTEHRHSEAEAAWRAALADAERLGPMDPHLFPPLDRLGDLYQTQGRTAEAEPLLRRALAVREQLLGADDPDVASSLESYAAVLRKLGRTAEAEPLETRARAIRAKTR